MDIALVVSALLMGLAGGPHCAAMCGAACGAVTGRGGSMSRSLVALHVGRLAGYAAGGAMAAASVASLDVFASTAPLLRPLWSIVHVAAVVLGAWLLWTARTPGWRSISSCITSRSITSISVGIESSSIFNRDAASSTRSIALSGRNLSLM